MWWREGEDKLACGRTSEGVRASVQACWRVRNVCDPPGRVSDRVRIHRGMRWHVGCVWVSERACERPCEREGVVEGACGVEGDLHPGLEVERLTN